MLARQLHENRDVGKREMRSPSATPCRSFNWRGKKSSRVFCQAHNTDPVHSRLVYLSYYFAFLSSFGLEQRFVRFFFPPVVTLPENKRDVTGKLHRSVILSLPSLHLFVFCLLDVFSGSQQHNKQGRFDISPTSRDEA